MESKMFRHTDAARAFFKWEIQQGNHVRVLVVETNLELDSEADGFDTARFDDLVDAATDFMNENNTVVDRIDVVPVLP